MSRTKIAPIALVALAAFSSAALAASQTKSGDVRSTDAAKNELTLSSGDTFELARGIKLDKIKAGDKVAVTYEMKDGKMWASKVTHTK
jgi:Cu/Ag efflux protein CusF